MPIFAGSNSSVTKQVQTGTIPKNFQSDTYQDVSHNSSTSSSDLPPTLIMEGHSQRALLLCKQMRKDRIRLESPRRVISEKILRPSILNLEQLRESDSYLASQDKHNLISEGEQDLRKHSDTYFEYDSNTAMRFLDNQNKTKSDEFPRVGNEMSAVSLSNPRLYENQNKNNFNESQQTRIEFSAVTQFLYDVNKESNNPCSQNDVLNESDNLSVMKLTNVQVGISTMTNKNVNKQNIENLGSNNMTMVKSGAIPTISALVSQKTSKARG